jgi:hypothetical protein
MIINHGDMGGEEIGYCLVLKLLGFYKAIVHLQSFCVVLGGWLFIKSRKVRKGVFLLFGVGVFWGNSI